MNNTFPINLNIGSIIVNDSTGNDVLSNNVVRELLVDGKTAGNTTITNNGTPETITTEILTDQWLTLISNHKLVIGTDSAAVVTSLFGGNSSYEGPFTLKQIGERLLSLCYFC